MNKFFCTAGPIQPEDHYYLPFRFDEAHIMELIDTKKYFIMHAPRQSGKTTAMRLLVDRLNAGSTYKALYVNVEEAQVARHDVARGMRTILTSIRANAIKTLEKNDPIFACIEHELQSPSDSSLGEVLRQWASLSDKPLVVFFDEIDALIGDTLLSVLRQLRSGYTNRPTNFPQSVCLIGVRDVRDYRIWSEKDQDIILGGSAFNIKAESLTIENFSHQEVADLYAQHTAATEQIFTQEAIDYAYQQTQGQPWLVNALAFQACFRDVKDRSLPITLDIMQQARETLIVRQDTHIDALIDKLSESRVRNIVDAIIAGGMVPDDLPSDDLQYAQDLGIITRKGVAIANPIYQEVFPRALTSIKQKTMPQKTAWYQNEDLSLNIQKLMTGWLDFYRENSAIWQEKFAYKESGPHLLIMAFLQRIINGGGSITREYALGRGRVDLLVAFGKQRFVIELKVWRDKKTIPEGLIQTAKYMQTAGVTEGHLVIFDRSMTKTWEEKIFYKTEMVDSLLIHVWGM